MSEFQAPPSYQRFDTETGFQEAIDRLLTQTGRELRIFDPDLSGLHLNAQERVGSLERFLLASRTRRILIALHDPGHLTSYCPRMMGLVARHSHAIAVHRTNDEIQSIQDSFLVLDQCHYVRRGVARFFRGAIGLDDDTEAQAMHSRFQEIWYASVPAISATTLGL